MFSIISFSVYQLFLFVGIDDAIAKSVLEELPTAQIFPDLNDHMMETAVGDNHVFQLVKTISKNYSKIRLYHLGKELTAKITGVPIRKRLTKLIHFKHQ